MKFDIGFASLLNQSLAIAIHTLNGELQKYLKDCSTFTSIKEFVFFSFLIIFSFSTIT